MHKTRASETAPKRAIGSIKMTPMNPNEAIPVHTLERLLDALENVCEKMELETVEDIDTNFLNHRNVIEFEAMHYFQYDLTFFENSSSQQKGLITSWLRMKSPRAQRMLIRIFSIDTSKRYLTYKGLSE